MALSTNLVSYWKLDESSGNAADSVGSNTLTNNNSTAFATGKINNGADFESSSSQFFSIADNASLSITGDFSASFWYKPESFLAPQTILGKYITTGNQRGYTIYLNNDSGGTQVIQCALSSDGSSVVDKGVLLGTFTNGTFYHFVVVYDASAGEVSFYKNGTQLGATQTAYPTSLFDNTDSFRLGCSQGTAQFADGVLDEVGIWSRTLTLTEVTTLYNSGNGNQYPFTEISTGASFLLNFI